MQSGLNDFDVPEFDKAEVLPCARCELPDFREQIDREAS